MSTQTSHSKMIGQRGELLAELFLEDLGAKFVARSEIPHFPYDLVMGFTTSTGGINIYAVEVKATEQPISSQYPLPRRSADSITKSNIPVLLLVVDVKRNRLYYALGPSVAQVAASQAGRQTVMVPVTEIDEHIKRELQAKLTS